MYVYIKSEPNLWTVGFYSPDGQWYADSDHTTSIDAAERVNWLNGGIGYLSREDEMQATIEKHKAFLKRMEEGYYKVKD